MLDLFDTPPTDMSLMNRREIKYQPFTSGFTPVEFAIPPQDGFVDMTRSYMIFKCKFKKGDGTALDALGAGFAYPITNVAHSMIQNFKVTLNGTLISGQSGLYAYKAFFDAILNNDREDGKTLMTSEGWYNGLDPPDGALTANQLDPTHNDFKALAPGEQEVQLNMRAEYARIREKERTYIFRPYNELFYLSKLLPPGVAINIQISLNAPVFYFNEYRGADEVSLTAPNFTAELVLCHVTPMVYLTRGLTQKMMKTATTYPTVRSEIRSYPLANTTRNFTIDNPFSGRIPNLLIVGMVRSDAYNGLTTRHPFQLAENDLLLLVEPLPRHLPTRRAGGGGGGGGGGGSSSSGSDGGGGGRRNLHARLRDMSNEQVQSAAGRHIAGVTTTHTVTTTYKDGRPPRVRRSSTSSRH